MQIFTTSFGDWALLIAVTVSVGFFLNLALSTWRLGISPTPSNFTMRNACIKAIRTVYVKESAICIAGSGWGGLVRQISQNFPDARIIGYEAAFAPWFVSKIALTWHKFRGFENVQLKKCLFKKTSFTPDSIVVAYLYPKGTQALFNQLLHQSPPPKALISIAFAVNQVLPSRKWSVNDLWKTPLYLYEFEKIKKAALLANKS